MRENAYNRLAKWRDRASERPATVAVFGLALLLLVGAGVVQETQNDSLPALEMKVPEVNQSTPETPTQSTGNTTENVTDNQTDGNTTS